jgi:hypothetical protein
VLNCSPFTRSVVGKRGYSSILGRIVPKLSVAKVDDPSAKDSKEP